MCDTIGTLGVGCGLYTITAAAEPGGAVVPAGPVSVPFGGDHTVFVVPNGRSRVLDVTVDGGSIGAAASHTFTGVDADHTLAASFACDTAHAPLPFVTAWGAAGSGTGQFQKPHSVAVDTLDNVYVTDADNSRVQKFTAAGAFLGAWGSLGSGPGEFDNPGGIAIAPDGHVHVVDYHNSRVQRFTGDGTFLGEWGSPGAAPGQLGGPVGIAIDSEGFVYVSEHVNARVQKLTATGTPILAWGSPGSGPGEFADPGGLAVDMAGNVYVADALNHRIQKFASLGAFAGEWGGPGSAPGRFDRPDGICVDDAGDFYVVDRGNHRIQKFRADGAFLTEWGGAGAAVRRFSQPLGIAWSGAGRLHVTDHLNHRVQVYGFDHTLLVDAIGSGTTCPAGSVGVVAGSSQAITFHPDAGYHLREVRVDGIPVGAPASYTLASIGADHAIEARFGPDPALAAIQPARGGTVTAVVSGLGLEPGAGVRLQRAPYADVVGTAVAVAEELRSRGAVEQKTRLSGRGSAS